MAPPARRSRGARRQGRYELISCGLHGHTLVGTDAAHIRPEDCAIVREVEGLRWHRCLRCDSLAPPTDPAGGPRHP